MGGSAFGMLPGVWVSDMATVPSTPECSSSIKRLMVSIRWYLGWGTSFRHVRGLDARGR